MSRERSYEEAIQTYNKLLELKPDYANAYGNLGYVYILLGQYEKAVAVSKEGIAMNPGYGPAYEILVLHSRNSEGTRRPSQLSTRP
jgi:tetratricopeptide (TPR) repeat protein